MALFGIKLVGMNAESAEKLLLTLADSHGHARPRAVQRRLIWRLAETQRGLHLRDRIASNADRTVSGPQDSLLGFKWMPVKSDAGFMLAVAGSVQFGSASRSKALGSGDRDYDLTLIATRQWAAVALDGS